MKKMPIILTLMAIFLLVGTVSATGPISFSQDGKITVTFVSKEAANQAEFGISSPVNYELGEIHANAVGSQWTYDYTAGSPVVLYIKTHVSAHEKYIFYSDGSGADASKWNVDHAQVTNSEGVYTVAFEDLYGGAVDYNDAIFTVSFTPKEIPTTIPTTVPTTDPVSGPVATPEFPTVALPAVLLVGIIGAVLVLRQNIEK
ncbi:MAG TPA: DUF4114 domain-containing protein [Methanoregula sp.]|nr:DUF4114 domain-containing protein [Methanoregula sp.]